MPSSRRGYCLTPAGMKKVETARLDFFPKLSWEELSFLGCLHRTTVSKVINGMSVDLRSIKKLFMAVSLKLNDEDYCLVKNDKKPTLTLGNKTMPVTNKELLMKAAEDLEKAANNESATVGKQELLNRAKELRTRAAELAD